MCGIVGVLTDGEIRPCNVDASAIHRIADELSSGPADLDPWVTALEEIAASLSGVSGAQVILQDPDGFEGAAAALMAALEPATTGIESSDERTLARVIRLRDAVWAVARDRVGLALSLQHLTASPADSVAVGYPVGVALSCLDRLEVRGRDSAGIAVLLWGADLGDDAISRARGRTDELHTDGSVITDGRTIAFIYKTAAEIGELGDNTTAIRASIRSDELFQELARIPGVRCTVLGHTRWASVGLVNEPNAHPVATDNGVLATLNGDVDNHMSLRDGLPIPPPIATDAQVIPYMVERDTADSLGERLRRSASRMEGSTAIGVVDISDPARLAFSLRGSGQGLFVGLGDGVTVVSSEVYGLVEQCERYVRLDGETSVNGAPIGEVAVCDSEAAGEETSVKVTGFGSADPASVQWRTPEVTTRDIDRAGSPHFLLKEVRESPVSFERTLRGRISSGRVSLAGESFPTEVVTRLRDRRISRVVVIGQGTAAVAASACANVMVKLTRGTDLDVTSMPATELSGFDLPNDMSDTLIVAISQSGTTTDTNRTVEIVRSRGASVVAIVNRRGSDLVDRSDGVVYTSDGRDVEMAVPSTKAFYAQVAAGVLVACAVAESAGGDLSAASEMVKALQEIPDAMRSVLATQEHIRSVARRTAPHRRHWAVVGSGPNRVAAQEIRIKISELCYMSISCDALEDKKHIDLSAEPLIVVCATGLFGSTADDAAKEVAIYSAHRSLPVLICNEGSSLAQLGGEVIPVPGVHPELDFLLCTVAGHLYGYEAAVAIDDLADPLRELRALVAESGQTEASEILHLLQSKGKQAARGMLTSLNGGSYDACLKPSTATRLAAALRLITSDLSIDAWSATFAPDATPSAAVESALEVITEAIDELRRPIDAIKHQAKTVTVGISRSDESLVTTRVVQSILAAGCDRERIGWEVLRSVAALEPGIEAVTGFTRYAISGDLETDATVAVIGKGGVAKGIPSRADTSAPLSGTKRRVAVERAPLVVRGRKDQRTVLIVPEFSSGDVVGITLLHLDLRKRIDPDRAEAMLRGYKDRLSMIRDTVIESEGSFDSTKLGELEVVDLLTLPVLDLAEEWRR